MVAVALQGAGLALFMLFGATFGARWGIFAAAVALLFLGLALGGDDRPAAPPAAAPGDPEEVLWTS